MIWGHGAPWRCSGNDRGRRDCHSCQGPMERGGMRKLKYREERSARGSDESKRAKEDSVPTPEVFDRRSRDIFQDLRDDPPIEPAGLRGAGFLEIRFHLV